MGLGTACFSFAHVRGFGSILCYVGPGRLLAVSAVFLLFSAIFLLISAVFLLISAVFLLISTVSLQNGWVLASFCCDLASFLPSFLLQTHYILVILSSEVSLMLTFRLMKSPRTASLPAGIWSITSSTTQLMPFVSKAFLPAILIIEQPTKTPFK